MITNLGLSTSQQKGNIGFGIKIKWGNGAKELLEKQFYKRFSECSPEVQKIDYPDGCDFQNSLREFNQTLHNVARIGTGKEGMTGKERKGTVTFSKFGDEVKIGFVSADGTACNLGKYGKNPPTLYPFDLCNATDLKHQRGSGVKHLIRYIGEMEVETKWRKASPDKVISHEQAIYAEIDKNNEPKSPWYKLARRLDELYPMRKV